MEKKKDLESHLTNWEEDLLHLIEKKQNKRTKREK